MKPLTSLIVPSRGRPDRFREMAISAIGTAEWPEALEFNVRLDVDDETLPQYLFMFEDEGLIVNLTVGERGTLGRAFNEAAKTATGDLLKMGGDDLIYRSFGWDQMMWDRLTDVPDRIALLWGRDGLHDHRLATHGAISRDWYRVVGYFTHPLLPGDYCDNWLMDLALTIRRPEYLPGIYTEHMHWVRGRGAMDQTYLDRKGKSDAAREIYHSKKVRRDFEKAAQALLEYIQRHARNELVSDLVEEG